MKNIEGLGMVVRELEEIAVRLIHAIHAIEGIDVNMELAKAPGKCPERKRGPLAKTMRSEDYLNVARTFGDPFTTSELARRCGGRAPRKVRKALRRMISLGMAISDAKGKWHLVQ